jgi:hypothetical protein
LEDVRSLFRKNLVEIHRMREVFHRYDYEDYMHVVKD